jgi:hypothetical protein
VAVQPQRRAVVTRRLRQVPTAAESLSSAPAAEASRDDTKQTRTCREQQDSTTHRDSTSGRHSWSRLHLEQLTVRLSHNNSQVQAQAPTNQQTVGGHNRPFHPHSPWPQTHLRQVGSRYSQTTQPQGANAHVPQSPQGIPPPKTQQQGALACVPAQSSPLTCVSCRPLPR